MHSDHSARLDPKCDAKVQTQQRVAESSDNPIIADKLQSNSFLLLVNSCKYLWMVHLPRLDFVQIKILLPTRVFVVSRKTDLRIIFPPL